MEPEVTWGRCTKPADGLFDAMVRIARQIAAEGEYDKVEIRSTPKDHAGGKAAAPHFKVLLIGTHNGRPVHHPHHLRIVHRNDRGEEWRYQMNSRSERYNYETFCAKKGPPGNCPRNRRLRREAAAAASEEKAADSSDMNDSSVASESSSEDGQSFPDGWYADPGASESGASLRWFENGQWTSYTR
ncbi:hypothetical protein QBC37DRAFT_407262 [Rhypophila decipiens]|uniref:Uncharacterized protein n=1 Tax=Rhypophila decipiens TaxID=261697 RepID=A0AAN6XSS1_9PEZI|nr:hypothetical protein QBC37DRAFT_407262 [Rhypophila decipiens]